MASKGVVLKQNTTGGTVYIYGRMNGKTFIPNYYGKVFKSRAGALKALKRNLS